MVEPGNGLAEKVDDHTLLLDLERFDIFKA